MEWTQGEAVGVLRYNYERVVMLGIVEGRGEAHEGTLVKLAAPRQYAHKLAGKLLLAGARPVWVPSVAINPGGSASLLATASLNNAMPLSMLVPNEIIQAVYERARRENTVGSSHDQA
eukprot:1151581-Pelagomonas_calceolata.AAC.8